VRVRQQNSETLERPHTSCARVLAMRRVVAGVATGVIASLGGCIGDISFPEACSADVSVELGPVPTFTWTPGCAVEVLRVDRAGDGATVWRVVNVNEGGVGHDITPPVQYGVTPPGTIINVSAEALVPGQEYLVWIGSGGSQFASGTSAGSTTFAHSP